MLLKTEIDQMNIALSSQLPAEILHAFGNAIEDLGDKKVAVDALKVGDRVSDFTLKSTDGQKVSLFQKLRNGPVVLSFQRGGWCPYCCLELRALNRLAIENPDLNFTILALTPELAQNATNTRNRNEVVFDVLIDKGNQVANEFALVFELQEHMRPIYSQLNIDISALNGDESYALPVPATYVIGKDGLIKYAFVDANYMNRAEPEDLLEVLES